MGDETGKVMAEAIKHSPSLHSGTSVSDETGKAMSEAIKYSYSLYAFNCAINYQLQRCAPSHKRDPPVPRLRRLGTTRASSPTPGCALHAVAGRGGVAAN